MSDTKHSAIHRFHGILPLTLQCTCGHEEETIVQIPEGGSDYDELEQMAYDLAGFSETGACWACDLSNAAEDRADQQMRDCKSAMEGSFSE